VLRDFFYLHAHLVHVHAQLARAGTPTAAGIVRDPTGTRRMLSVVLSVHPDNSRQN
jgi:hypothetical protein